MVPFFSAYSPSYHWLLTGSLIQQTWFLHLCYLCLHSPHIFSTCLCGINSPLQTVWQVVFWVPNGRVYHALPSWKRSCPGCGQLSWSPLELGTFTRAGANEGNVHGAWGCSQCGFCTMHCFSRDHASSDWFQEEQNQSQQGLWRKQKSHIGSNITHPHVCPPFHQVG